MLLPSRWRIPQPVQDHSDSSEPAVQACHERTPRVLRCRCLHRDDTAARHIRPRKSGSGIHRTWMASQHAIHQHRGVTQSLEIDNPGILLTIDDGKTYWQLESASMSCPP
jgi:hypothetical protein